MRRRAVLFLALATLPLMAPRRLPPPTPSAGLYRVEMLTGSTAGSVSAVCHAPGLGGYLMGDARRPTDEMVCGELRVVRVGDGGWDARQTCRAGADTYSAVAMARREPNGDLRVDYAMQPRSRSAPIPPVESLLLRRIGPRCPAPLRPGHYVTLRPRPGEGRPWRVRRIGAGALAEDPAMTVLPPALRSVDAAASSAPPASR